MTTNVTWIERSWLSRQTFPNPNNGEAFYAAGPQQEDIVKGVLHGTEGAGFPDYRNYNVPSSPPGVFNPHFTYQPLTLETRQHVPLNRGARALVASNSAPLTNVGGVFQVEIIGTCDPRNTSLFQYPRMNRTQMWGLARLLRAVAVETGTFPLEVADGVRWTAYPASYGSAAGNRLAYSAFLRAEGLMSHQNVPGNLHGDTGDLDLAALAALCQMDLQLPAGLTLSPGAKGPAVGLLQMILIEDGQDVGPEGIDESFGPATQAAMKAWKDRRRARGIRMSTTSSWDSLCWGAYEDENPHTALVAAGVIPDLTPPTPEPEPEPTPEPTPEPEPEPTPEPEPEPTPEPEPEPEDLAPLLADLVSRVEEINSAVAALGAKVELLVGMVSQEGDGLTPGEVQAIADLTVQGVADLVEEPLRVLQHKPSPPSADEIAATVLERMVVGLTEAMVDAREQASVVVPLTGQSVLDDDETVGSEALAGPEETDLP